MLIFKRTFLRFKHEISLERIYIVGIGLIITFVLISALTALYRPVGQAKFQVIRGLATSANNPETQKMAQQLLKRQTVRRADYLKLMHAYQVENAKAQHYPAVAAPAKH